MPQTRQQAKTAGDNVSKSTASPPTYLHPAAPTIDGTKFHGKASPKSPVGITIDKSIQQKIQTSAVITVTGRRRSQRSSQKKVAVEEAAATAAEAEQRQSRMFAQYRERQAGEEARLNAQHIGMLRYLKLCY